MGSLFNSISIVILSIWLLIHTFNNHDDVKSLQERIKSLEEQIKEKENNNGY